MVPTRIIARAIEKGLEAIGICDHNSTENIPAVRKAGRKDGITVFGGIEITTSEEIHLLALFDEDSDLFQMQEKIYQNLEGENDSAAFGEQYIVDEEDFVISTNNRLLIGATGLSIDIIVASIHEFNGIVIASHVDREAFSIISQLGFIPRDLKLDALELSPNCKELPVLYSDVKYPFVTFSDAHRLDDIGRTATCFHIEKPTISELKKAFRNTEGRKCSTFHCTFSIS